MLVSIVLAALVNASTRTTYTDPGYQPEHRHKRRRRALENRAECHVRLHVSPTFAGLAVPLITTNIDQRPDPSLIDFRTRPSCGLLLAYFTTSTCSPPVLL